jgi:hypothetical protein
MLSEKRANMVGENAVFVRRGLVDGYAAVDS